MTTDTTSVVKSNSSSKLATNTSSGSQPSSSNNNSSVGQGSPRVEHSPRLVEESSDAVISPVGAAQDACSGSMAAKKSLTGLGNGKEQSSASRVAQARAEAARSSRSKVRQQRGASTGPQQLSSTTAAGGGLQESCGTTQSLARTRTLSPQEGDPAESSVVKPAVESRRWSDMTSDEDSEPIAPKLRKFDPPKRSFSSVVTGGLMKKTSCEVNKVNRPGSPPAQQGSAVATVVGAKGKTTRITCKSARGVKSAVTGDTTSTPVTPEATAVTEQTKTQAPAETNVKNKGITKKGGENNPSTPTVIQQQQQEEIETTVGTTGSPKGSAVPLNSARGSARVSSGNKKSTMSKAATTAGCRRQSKSGSRAEEKRTEMATVPEENELSGYGAESMETAHWGTMPPAGQCHPLPGFYPPNGMPPMMMFPGPGYPSVPMLTPMLPQGYGPLMGNLPPYDHPHFGPEGEMNSSRGTPQKKRSKEANRKQQQQWNGVSPMQGGLPQAHMYGHIRRHPTATIVYTTSPIPQDTTSIILVPMANGNQSGGHHPAVPIIGSYPIPQFDNNNGPPPSPPVTHPPSGPQSLRSVRTHSVASEASFDGTRPVTVCIDRNVFKSWFDTDVPEFQQLRVKRYRTIDSFVHWMMKYCKRKSIYHGLFILIRVTEAEKLLEVLTRLIPTWHNVVMGIYVYEQSRGKVGKPLQRKVGQHLPIRQDPRVTIVETLAETCRCAIASGAGVENPSVLSSTPLRLNESASPDVSVGESSVLGTTTNSSKEKA